MPEFLSIGTNRGFSMIGTGIGLGVSGFRLPSVGFSPSSISGLQLWLDASDASTVYQAAAGSLATADGDPVGQWQDKSGNARHFAQASGTNKPALKTAIKNGRNVIRWDGVDDYLDGGDILDFGTGAFSIFIVLRNSVTTDTPVFVKDNGNGSELGVFISLNSVSSNSGITYWNGSNNTFGYASATVAWMQPSVVRTGTGANGVTCYANGSLGATLTDSRNLSNARSIRLGQYSTGSFGKFSGDFAEILVWNVALDSTQRGQVNTYLRSKWAVY